MNLIQQLEKEQYDKLAASKDIPDFAPGDTLIVKDDIFIIDFEGDPRLPLSMRRRRAPAARLVALLPPNRPSLPPPRPDLR